MKLYPRGTTFYARMPSLFRIYASNDITGNRKTTFTTQYWTKIYEEAVGITFTSMSGNQIDINCTTAYKSYAIVIHKTNIQPSTVETDISSIEYYGTPNKCIQTTGKPSYPLTNAYTWNGITTDATDNTYMSYTSVPDIKTLLSYLSNMSISFVYNSSDVFNSHNLFFIGDVPSATNYIVNIYVSSNNLYLNVGDGLGTYYTISTSVSVNTWYSFIFVINYSNNVLQTKIYKDKILSASGSSTNYNPNFNALSSLVMYLGKDPQQTNDASPATLQDFRLFDKLLSTDEITAIYDGSTTWINSGIVSTQENIATERFLDSPSYYYDKYIYTLY
jgi:hypothetical protein